MKKMITMAVLATGLMACSDEGQQAQAPKQAVQPVSQAEILNYIPAKTPLLALGGLNNDQLPKGYVDTMEGYLEASMESMESVVDQALQTIIDKGGDEAAMIENKVKPFINKWFIEGEMKDLGLTFKDAQFAMYAVDLFPVLRLKLNPGHQMDTMLDEAAKEFEMPFNVTTVGDMKVREAGNHEMTLMIGVSDGYLVVTAAPTPIKDQIANQLLGQEKPSASLAQDNSMLSEVKNKHGFIFDDVFVLDVAQVADYFINPAKHNSALLNFLQVEDNMLSDVCKTEFTAMVNNMPRWVAGLTSISDTSYGMKMVFETSESIGTDLAQLAGRVPSTNNDSALSFGLSFDILNAKKVAQKYAQSLVDAPYQCEHLVAINGNASTLLAQASQPLPPMVSNFKGIAYSLDDLKLNPAAIDSTTGEKIVENVKAQVLVAVDNADALMGMAQMMVPQLAEVTLNTDGSLIHLGDKLPVSGKDIPVDIEHLFGAMSDHTIGLSLGHDQGGHLSDLVKSDGQNKLLTFSASGEGYKNIMEQIFAMTDMPGLPEKVKQELQLQKDMTLNTVYWKHAEGSLTFTPDGLVFDTQVQF